jgi:hypothetical protein
LAGREVGTAEGVELGGMNELGIALDGECPDEGSVLGTTDKVGL